MTRPDIAYHMSMLCSVMHDPSLAAYDAAIYLLFLSGSADTYLHFPGQPNIPPGIEDPSLRENLQATYGFIAFSDASWRKPDKLGYSMYGYVIYVYGAPVSYASKILKIIALSSAEAEYSAATNTSRELVFLRNILIDLGLTIQSPTVIAMDNQAAITIVQNQGVTARNKHFEESLHYLRHLYDHRIIKPAYVTTRNQRADGMTKALDATSFKRWAPCVRASEPNSHEKNQRACIQTMSRMPKCIFDLTSRVCLVIAHL